MALDAMTLQVTGEKNNPFVCTEKVVNLLLQLMTNRRENKSVAFIFVLSVLEDYGLSRCDTLYPGMMEGPTLFGGKGQSLLDLYVSLVFFFI